MSRKKDNSHWFIILAIIIILLIAVLAYYFSDESATEKEESVQERNTEEDRLLKELKALEEKKAIISKHEFIHKFTLEYMNSLAEKRYRQLIQVLITLLILTNVGIYFLVPDTKFIDLFNWNFVALGLLNLIGVFFFMSVKRAKEYLKDLVMNYIEYRVYENRDKKYYHEKIELIQAEIKSIENEIEIKTNQLNKSEIKNA